METRIRESLIDLKSQVPGKRPQLVYMAPPPSTIKRPSRGGNYNATPTTPFSLLGGPGCKVQRKFYLLMGHQASKAIFTP